VKHLEIDSPQKII